MFSLFRCLTLPALIAVTLLFSLSSFAQQTFTTEQKISDLDQLVGMMKHGYGPLRYKKDFLGLDVDQIRNAYAEQLAATQSNSEFYYTLLKFIAEFKDGHFRAAVPSDVTASLPLDVDLIDGRILVTTLNKEGLAAAKCEQLQIGDEVSAVDGLMAMDVAKDLASYRSLASEQSSLRAGTMAMTFRTAARLPIPQGKTTITFAHGVASENGGFYNCEFEWKLTGTPADELPKPKNRYNIVRPKRDFHDLAIFDIMSELQNPQTERSFRCSGSTRMKIPDGATMLRQDPFVAYYFPTDRGNIGYLRIPHYSFADNAAAFLQYQKTVADLEANTVGLLIDQNHNCGGSVEFMHQMISLFATEPFKPMQFELLANKEEYLSFKGWMKTLPRDTIATSQMQKVVDLLWNSWQSGAYMTPKTDIDGQDVIDPDKHHYSKPIVMMIDEMSGSGGDGFPSMLQGIGRARLIGTPTMGLGGHVETQAALNYSRIVPDMTKSLFYRPDGVAVENNGAIPADADRYTTTRADLLGGYQDYMRYALQKLNESLVAPTVQP